MKEKISMNQKRINVYLVARDEVTDILRFCFDSEELEVNLNSDSCQAELKRVFVKLLHDVIESDIELVFVAEEGYSRQFYIEACEEYVKDLNRELESTKKKLRKELRRE